MSIKTQIKILEAHYKPEKKIIFCMSEDEITGDPDDSDVFYVVLNLDMPAVTPSLQQTEQQHELP